MFEIMPVISIMFQLQLVHHLFISKALTIDN